MKIRCIKAEIYKDRNGDCSNGGISSRFSDVYIPHEEGPYTIESDDTENLCIVEVKEFFKKEYTRLVPSKLKTSGKWYMMGGCFAYSCDSRFREISEYPLPIHDRVE